MYCTAGLYRFLMPIRGKHNSGSIINVFINMLRCVTIIIFFRFSPPPLQNAVPLAFFIYLLESIQSTANTALQSQALGKMKLFQK